MKLPILNVSYRLGATYLGPMGPKNTY